MIKLKNQIYFYDIYKEIVDCFIEDKPKFIKLFEEYIDLEILILQLFFNVYYTSTDHSRNYSLSSMLTALIIQKILGLPETKTFLNISSKLITLCRFFKVPHESQFSKFKSELFIADIIQLITIIISFRINNKSNFLQQNLL